MQPLRTSTLILVSVAAALALYAALALVLALHGQWLHSVVGAGASLPERLAFTLRHAVRDWALILALAMSLWVAYRIANGVLATRRIASRRAERGQVLREMFFFGYGVIVLAVQAAIATILQEAGYSKRYDDIAQYGWAYALFSVALFVLLTDAWSYFLHLGYHRFRPYYRISHHVHHLSVVTTQWTTFQGSPIEILPPMLLNAVMMAVMPFPTAGLALVMVANLVFTMTSHGGIEVFPRGTATHPLGRFLVTPTYHQMHHEDGESNLALYFNWWDRMFGTSNSGYEARFEKVTASARPQGAPEQPAAPEDTTLSLP